MKKLLLALCILFGVSSVAFYAPLRRNILKYWNIYFEVSEVKIQLLSEEERKALNLSTESIELLDNQPFQYHKISFKNYPFSLVLPRVIWETDKENINYDCESFKEHLRNSIEEMEKNITHKYPISQINFLKKRLQETACQEGYRINITTGDNNQKKINLYTLVNENENNINISLSTIAIEKAHERIQKANKRLKNDEETYFVSGERKFRKVPLAIFIPHQENPNLVYELSGLGIHEFDEQHMAILYE